MVRNADGVEEGLVDGDSLSVGDGLVLHFRASRDLHVYVLNEDARGEAFVLFPLAGYDLRNPLSADVLHVLPGVRDGQRVEWVVTSAGERERFIVIASPGAVASLEEELDALPVAGSLPGEATPEPTSGRRGTGGTRVVAEGPVRLAPGRLAALLGKLPLGSEPSGSDGLWVRTFEFRNPETP